MKKPTLKNQLKELNDKYLRLHADFENARKKSAEEKLNLIIGNFLKPSKNQFEPIKK